MFQNSDNKLEFNVFHNAEEYSMKSPAWLKWLPMYMYFEKKLILKKNHKIAWGK